MKAYLDTSAVLRHILDGDRLLDPDSPCVHGSSELLIIEGARVFERHRLAGLWDDVALCEAIERLDTFVGRLLLFELTAGIKRRAAEAFPTVVGTLDALHLATALAWRDAEPMDRVVIHTYDRQMALCARALGFEVRP